MDAATAKARGALPAADRRDRPCLLIVDDDMNFGESLQLALIDDYDVSISHSVEEAKALFDDGIPDVALIDLRLPDGDGIDVLRELKRRGGMPLAIIMTAFLTADHRMRALEEGATDCISKPFVIGRLKRDIRSRLERRSQAASGS